MAGFEPTHGVLDVGEGLGRRRDCVFVDRSQRAAETQSNGGEVDAGQIETVARIVERARKREDELADALRVGLGDAHVEVAGLYGVARAERAVTTEAVDQKAAEQAREIGLTDDRQREAVLVEL